MNYFIRSPLAWLAASMVIISVQYPNLWEDIKEMAHPIVQMVLAAAPPELRAVLDTMEGVRDTTADVSVSTPKSSANSTTSKVQWVENPFYSF